MSDTPTIYLKFASTVAGETMKVIEAGLADWLSVIDERLDRTYAGRSSKRQQYTVKGPTLSENCREVTISFVVKAAAGRLVHAGHHEIPELLWGRLPAAMTQGMSYDADL